MVSWTRLREPLDGLEISQGTVPGVTSQWGACLAEQVAAHVEWQSTGSECGLVGGCEPKHEAQAARNEESSGD